MSRINELHLNVPQLKIQLVQANETYAVLSRAVGKSTGVASIWSFHRVKRMPGSSGFALGKDYLQLRARTLPPMINYWYKMGLVRDIDFVIAKKPPVNWSSKPIVAPEDWSNAITFSNGTIMHLISQHRPGNPNSLSLMWGMVDEAKLINMERFNEDLVPAMRGNRELFGHLPEYNSLLFMTDQPTTPNGQWIWKKEDEMDPKQIRLIMQIQLAISKAQLELQEAKSRKHMEYKAGEIRKLQKMLDEARMDSIYYIEANALDNIDVLGADYIRKQKRLLPDSIFRISILNERMTKVEHGFYPFLDDKNHCYSNYNDVYLQSIALGDQVPNDCRRDGDLIEADPLYIALDHGSSINCLSVAQPTTNHVSFKNFFYVLHPQTTADLVSNFCTYYAPRKNKTVVLYYDHTAVAESGKARNITYLSEIEDKLKEFGWRVRKEYLGRTPSHSDRFLLWSHCLRGDRGYPTVSFNEDHTSVLRTSMHTAPAVPGRKENEIKKDKKSERDKKLSQEKATHPSDSADLLLCGLADIKSRGTSTRGLPYVTA